MTETHHTFCRICESLCGLEVTVDGNRITHVKPDRAHVATGGFGCVKGMKQHQIYQSPDRVRQPLKRVGDRHEPATWDEALADIGARVKALRRERGPDSIAMYVGTAAGFSVLHPVFAQGFMTGLGSRSMYASATQDCSNKFAVARRLYGFDFLQPYPDLEHTQCLIIVGANPVVSKWSFLQVANPYKTLKAMEKRGCRVVVVDPRETETAQAAGQWVPIRPSTDVWFYLAFLHEVFAREAVDEAALQHLEGVDALRELVAPWSPERAAEVTGIPADTLRDVVGAYVEADGAALYSSTGVNMGGQGALCFWLQEAIQAITGNLDRPGGTLVGHGVIDFADFGKKNGVFTRRDTSRIGGFTAVNDAFPGGILADEILTPGDRQVRALFVTGGNPLMMMPNAGRLRRAFDDLELLVTVDIQRNETGQLADWVLPATDPFQRFDLPFIFPLMVGLQSRPYLQATTPVVQPEGEERDEATIYHDLARACGVGLFGSQAATAVLEAWRRWHRFARPGAGPGLPQEGLLDLLLRLTGQGSFRGLLGARSGRPRDVEVPGTFLGQRVLTDSGRVELAPEPLLARARDLEADFDRERALASGSGLRLITRRELTTHNSWTHNIDAFVRHHQGTNRLSMHPDDAAARGLSEGDLVDLSTATATVRVPLTLDPTVRRGVCTLPHGWGHQHAKGMKVASATSGVNYNLLVADGPDAVDPLSGMARITGLDITVTQAAGPRAHTWSGLPEAAPTDEAALTDEAAPG